MIKLATYQENARKPMKFAYDTDWIKDGCCDCGRSFQESSPEESCKRYEARGNYCAACNGSYSHLHGAIKKL